MHWEILIIPLIALGVWILGTLFKTGEDDKMKKGVRRPGSVSGRGSGRRPVTDLDRFLDEARRRREAEERPKPSPPPAPTRPKIAVSPPRQRPAPPREEARVAPPIARRAEVPLTVPVARPVAQPARAEPVVATSRDAPPPQCPPPHALRSRRRFCNRYVPC